MDMFCYPIKYNVCSYISKTLHSAANELLQVSRKYFYENISIILFLSWACI